MHDHDDTGHGPCPEDHADERPRTDALYAAAYLVMAAVFAGLLLWVSR